ncbi:unnamed protein product [Allacma fusca]|uniref:Uncharacterized protein n=1 Tax=Allacma fusca TaxID=39272 RepID=A0A8J2NYJ0_9HEXA|nr:unnamed protein product [Allacma fusca]
MAYSQKRDIYQYAYSADEEDFPLLEPYNPAKKNLSNQKPFDFFRFLPNCWDAETFAQKLVPPTYTSVDKFRAANPQ